MLKLTDIKKDYKIASGVVHALRGVSLEFRKNEFVCVLGQSGCGKTTLLNIIGGLDHYTSGDLVIQGRSTKDFKDRDWDVYRNHRIGFVFQTYNLIPHQTVLSNVELALTIAGLGKEERRERAKKALERVGLGEELNKRPNQLSGGQMQRVAIARALVNDPDILLADEPTGALDSKTSVEVMDLIKEIAGERLVIMVTHNPELAEEYASRIVRLKDGVVESDSNPYEGTIEEHSSAESEKEAAKTPEKGKKNRARMGFLTSLSLSFKNLLTKKGRTIITSVAGSIGIISVCLVLALSNGFNNYIRHTEEDMLSYYPLHISENTLDVTSIMSAMNSINDRPDLSQIGDKIYINSFLTSLAQGIMVQNNITQDYVDYLDKGIKDHPDWFSAIQYDYGFSIGDYLYTPVVVGAETTNKEEHVENYSINSLRSYLIDELIEFAPEYSNLLRFVNLFTDVVNKMPGTADFSDSRYGEYVQAQYDIIAGHFPQNEHEAVLVVGEDNSLIDLTLVQLGFLTEEQFLALFDLGVTNKDDTVASALSSTTALAEQPDNANLLDFDRIFEQQYALYYNNAVYTEDESWSALKQVMDPTAYRFTYQETVEGDCIPTAEQGIDFKISGILRLKKGYTYGCLSSGLNLTEAAIEKYLEGNADSKIAAHIREYSTDKNPTTGEDIGYTIWFMPPSANLATSYNYSLQGMPFTISDSVIRSVGGETLTNSIYIYPSNFDAKEHVMDYLDTWNQTHSEEENIKYNDTVGLLMGMMQTMLNVITYVLVAFTAISLVVSSVMIGIITYVSVVERTKEIGVLRSLGARKQDIRNLFNAETFIIGLTAGLIGIGVTYILAAIVSVIIESLSGIAGIATLPVLTAFIMVCVSVVLTLISGLIPAQAAAKKDPVIALRTE